MAALETQVAELAEQVRTSKQDAAAARVLAGGADRDVTEIRGEIRDLRQPPRPVSTPCGMTCATFGGTPRTGSPRCAAKLDAAAAGQQQIVALPIRRLPFHKPCKQVIG